MDSLTLLTDLQLQGITFRVAGDFLDVSGPDDLLTPATLDAIRTSKSELLKLLRQPTNDPASIPESITEPPPTSSAVRYVAMQIGVVLARHQTVVSYGVV